MNTSKVDGFAVIVLQGREISEAAFAQLSGSEQAACKRKVNGPHHEAQWARHQRGAVTQTEWRKRAKAS